MTTVTLRYFWVRKLFFKWNGLFQNAVWMGAISGNIRCKREKMLLKKIFYTSNIQ